MGGLCTDNLKSLLRGSGGHQVCYFLFIITFFFSFLICFKYKDAMEERI